MKHALIPSRDAAIVDALTKGTSVADVARRWGLCEAYVRSIARSNGYRLEQQRPTVDPIKAYAPSTEARDVLTSVGLDPDTIPGRHLTCSSRDAEILELLLVDALTLDEAGKRYGLTRERVRQIQVRYLGVSAKVFHARRAALAEQVRVDRITAYALAHPTATGREIADTVGVLVSEVRDVIGPDQVALRERPTRKGLPGVGDDAVLAEIRRVAALPGGVPLRSTFFDTHRRDGMIGVIRILQRFGTWREACEAAGVAPMPAMRPSYTRRWNDQDMRDLLDRYVVEAWGSWSYANFDTWLRSQDGSPSAQTVRNQLGLRWQELLQQSLGRVGAVAERVAQA